MTRDDLWMQWRRMCSALAAVNVDRIEAEPAERSVRVDVHCHLGTYSGGITIEFPGDPEYMAMKAMEIGRRVEETAHAFASRTAPP